jgi:hypothetical protein
MREIRQSGSEGGGTETNRPSLPLLIRVPHLRGPRLTAGPDFAALIAMFPQIGHPSVSPPGSAFPG